MEDHIRKPVPRPRSSRRWLIPALAAAALAAGALGFLGVRWGIGAFLASDHDTARRFRARRQLSSERGALLDLFIRL